MKIFRPRGYKYRLHYLLRQLSFDDYQIAMKWFPEKIGISTETWKKWIYIPARDKREIPSTALIIMATFFGCEANEMLEEPITTESVINSFKTYKQNETVH